MIEVRIYIADLAAYNNAQMRGEWVTLPIPEEELDTIVHKYTNEGRGDYEILDYEGPFPKDAIGNDPWRLNRWAATLSNLPTLHELDEDVIYAVLQDFTDPTEPLAILSDPNRFRVYRARTMGEVAYDFLASQGLFSSLPEELRDEVRDYFDFEKYGDDLRQAGDWIQGDGFFVEISEN